MRTICICSTKGGTGKSTLATSLAVCASASGKKVALLDYDGGQASTLEWAKLRAKQKLNGPDILKPHALTADLRRLTKQGYDFAIVDTPPTFDEGGILENSIDVADFILSPCRPSMFDVGASRQIVTLVGDVRFGFVITDATEEWASVNKSATKLLASIGHVFKCRLAHRQAYVRAVPLGKVAAELDREAAEEIDALWEELASWMR